MKFKDYVTRGNKSDKKSNIGGLRFNYYDNNPNDKDAKKDKDEIIREIY